MKIIIDDMSYISYNKRREEVFDVLIYEKDNGDSPFLEFMGELEVKMRAKVASMIELLKEYGNELRAPYTEHLGDGLFELRVKQGSNITRVIFFFYINNTIIITNGFVKKSQRTPKREIEKAKKYRNDFYSKAGDDHD